MSKKRKGLGLIEGAWRSYLNEVMPAECGETQRRETRRAFYAGALALLSGVIGKLDHDTDDVTPDELALMDDVRAELDGHAQAMARGDA